MQTSANIYHSLHPLVNSRHHASCEAVAQLHLSISKHLLIPSPTSRC